MLTDRRNAAVRKFRDRMNSATHEIALQLAGYASRRRFAQVRYHDNDHSYVGGEFPWYRLRSLIAGKWDARGIALEASAQPAEETPGPLAEELSLMITGFALPTSAARSPAGTLADPTARLRRLNVWDIPACPDRPGSDQTIYRSFRLGLRFSFSPGQLRK
jgi:hypothetical protein